MKKRFVFVLCIFTTLIVNGQIQKLKLDSNSFNSIYRLSASGMHSSESKLFTFILKDNIDAGFRKQISANTEIRSKLKQELAFINFKDSITRKEFDRFFWETVFATKTNSKSVFSFVIDGPLLNTYKYFLEDGELQKDKKGGFLCPSLISVGYGFEKKLFKKSRLKICYIAFDGEIKRIGNNFVDDNKYLFKGKAQYFKVDYSFNLVLDIKENIGKNLKIKSLVTLNTKGLSQDNIIFRLDNNFFMPITNNIEIIFSTKAIYNPSISYQVYWYNELCLSFYFRKKIEFNKKN